MISDKVRRQIVTLRCFVDECEYGDYMLSVRVLAALVALENGVSGLTPELVASWSASVVSELRDGRPDIDDFEQTILDVIVVLSEIFKLSLIATVSTLAR